MNSEKKSRKLSVVNHTLLSIFLQLLPVLIFFLIFGFTTCMSYGDRGVCALNGEVYFVSFPFINYLILFAVIIVSSVQATTKNELLATAMNVVWILFIWKETKYAYYLFPFDYLFFMLSISLTLPIRILVQRRFSPDQTTSSSDTSLHTNETA